MKVANRIPKLDVVNPSRTPHFLDILELDALNHGSSSRPSACRLAAPQEESSS
jgi:hypothetical protein